MMNVDTICAVATAPGVGAIAVIRVSGPETYAIVQSLFPKKDLAKQPSHTLVYGVLKDGEELLDEVLLSLFRGPRSYTKEDTIEISTHGSPYIVRRILQALRSPAFIHRSYAVLAQLSLRYPPRLGTFRCITHPFATRQHPKTCYRSTCMCKACRQRSI